MLETIGIISVIIYVLSVLICWAGVVYIGYEDPTTPTEYFILLAVSLIPIVNTCIIGTNIIDQYLF